KNSIRTDAAQMRAFLHSHSREGPSCQSGCPYAQTINTERTTAQVFCCAPWRTATPVANAPRMGKWKCRRYAVAVWRRLRVSRDSSAQVRFVRATIKGVLDTIKDPDTAIKSVMARNETADPKIELDRLKMSLRDNFVTPWVKANGFGGVDMARL